MIEFRIKIHSNKIDKEFCSLCKQKQHKTLWINALLINVCTVHYKHIKNILKLTYIGINNLLSSVEK